MTVPALPDDTLYFHAQYRQAAPNAATDQRLADQPGRQRAAQPGRQPRTTSTAKRAGAAT